MANEVEITITGRDRSGPALASARGRARAFASDTKATLAKAGQDAGRQMGDGIVRGVDGRLRDSRGRFVKGGSDLGGDIVDGIESGTRRGGQIVGGFASNILRTFSRMGPLMGAAVTAGLYGAAASAGTAAGAVALAAGGAITTIGVISAAQSMKVRREWSETGREVKAELADAAAPMERSALRAASVTRSTFGRLKPFLSNFFRDSEPAVDRFVEAIGNGVASLGPALRPLQRGYSAVLDAISARSPRIFGSLERSLSNLGETAEEHADDIAAALEFVAGAVETTTEVVDSLADSWSRFTDDVAATGEAADSASRGFAEWMVGLYESLGINTDRMRELKGEWAAADAAAANTSGVDAAREATSGLSGSVQDAAAGLRDLATEMEELTGAAITAADAQIRVEEAIDRAAESVRENGRTLDVNTEAGRANRDAVLDIARAAQKHIAAMQQEGASTDAIASTYGRYRSQLARTLRQAGATRAEARLLTEAWLETPESVLTHVRANIGDLEGKIATAKARLRDPKLTRPERARLRAEISQLEGAVARARALLASVQSKTVTIRVRTERQEFAARASWRAHGGIIGGLGGVKRFQDGGVAGSGSSLAMVGEQGPELVRLPVGSTVTPAGQTRALMGGGGGGFGSISMAFRSAQSSGLGGSGSLTESLREVLSFREALEKLSSTLIGQTRAVSAYEAAWDAAGRSLKENGKRLSLTTEKGRQNRGALLDLAEAAREVVVAMHEQGRSSSTLISTMKEQRAEFITMARRMGLSKADAGAMADRMGLTTAGVRSALAASSGKAGGGPAGGWTMVGERGAELVRLPFGSSVVPAGQSATMMAGTGGPVGVVLEVRGGDSEFSRFMAQWIRKFVHAKGGNVQTAFGSGRA